jgi:outer membrane receptor protein involved in Fe transport
VNRQTGAQREATTQATGFYALLGLVPAEYDVTARQIGRAPLKLQVRVLVGEVFPLDFRLTASAVQVEAVTVVAASGVETRTSEVATNVTPQQIQNLPTPSRNFLDLAALAPGVTVTPDFVNLGGNTVTARTFTAGAQGPGEVNVFVDGASLKNDLTGNGASGVAGQDASRGNPFPRNAIQEYRVITQNFKAEYQNASSAIITATTKSGGNVWSGDAFFTYENKNLVTLDSITAATAAKDTSFRKPDYSRYLLGLSAGGPIVPDKLFFFGSYEGNYQNRANIVNIHPPTAGIFNSLDTVGLGSFNGNITSPFRETLVFGKLTYNWSSHSSAELSFNDRHETDIRDFGGLAAYQAAVNYVNDMSTGVLKYNYFSGPWLDEASVTYENFERNPSPNAPGLAHRTYRGSPSIGFTGADIGSNLTLQDFTQKSIGLRNNVTYTGFHGGGDHVIKAGAMVNFLTFDINKGNNETPQFFYHDTVSAGDANCGCTGPLAYNYRVPYQVQFATGNPLVNAKNTQIGAFLQDDWSPTPRLTLNLGVRWDFETHMFNYDYVTPKDVRDTIGRYVNDPTFLPAPIDTSEYFTNGTQRQKFYGAWQPRLGFSYALDNENKTTLFGGWGLFYDRSFFDVSVDEQLKLTRPLWTVYFADPDSAVKTGQVRWDNRYLTNPAALDSLASNGKTGFREVWLIGNHTKVPYSTQWNLGVRHTFGDVSVSAAYVGVRGHDGFVLYWANITWNNFGTPTSACCTFRGNAHGFSNVIVSTNAVQTWYDALQVQIVRPYKRVGKWGWGGGLTFTSGQRSLQGIDNPDDQFAFPQPQFIIKHPSNDEKSRVVANWIVDLPFAYGIQLSGLMTLGSGPRYDVGGRFSPNSWVPGGFSPPQYPFIVPGAWAYRDVDLTLTKDLPQLGRGILSLRVDVFNVFNFQNFTYAGSPTPTGLLSDARRVQFGTEYRF